ncbi:hypothetical protein [Pedobacter panaciterrae]|jgi:hypothetical protein|uniref:Glycerophosphoryl diester phosphodiesterase membrane domain-containing protein n=1 Tax=Pedobacter panaciterrae TaxID=363849 RepID=A0ABU8NRS2_9SPHI|nr:hypothetical protein [Pedobacter panaciterrae]NQX54989.1 hypothetical protein [Pedobacter panaciterrae]
MSDKLEFRKLREFGEIINDMFQFIKQNFKPLMKTYIYLCGFFVLAGMLAAIMYQVGLQKINFGYGGNQANANPFNRFGQLFSFNYFVVIIFSLLNYTAITVSTLSFIALYVQKGNQAPTVEEVWSYFKYYFLRVFGSSIAVCIFLIICLLFCGLPFFYVFPAMSLFYSIMVVENGSFEYSFSRSFKLLKDQWWVTAGAIFVIWIITYACMSMASMPAIILTMVSAFTKASGGMSTFIIVISTVIQYVCQVFMILPVIGVTLCYFNLVERLDNTGLLERINQLGKSETNLNSTPEDY